MGENVTKEGTSSISVIVHFKCEYGLDSQQAIAILIKTKVKHKYFPFLVKRY